MDNAQMTWEECRRWFKKTLPVVSHAYNPCDIFCDACRIFSLSLRGTVTVDENERGEIERQYSDFRRKYRAEGMTQISILLAYTMEALEIERHDFLGHIYEDLNATVKSFGQFFTPDSVSSMMAQCTVGGDKPVPGKIVTLSDPTCGAGALLIGTAETFIARGGRQGDLLIQADDLDATACCIAYTQLSLLGYPAIVRRMDSLSMKVYEGPWYTPGYYLHGMPMRRIAA